MEKILSKKLTLVLALLLAALGLSTAAQNKKMTQRNLGINQSSPHLAVKSPAADKKASKPYKAKAGEAMHQVDFVFDFDTDSQIVDGFILCNEAGTLDNYELGMYQFENGSNLASIPDGTYDILVKFRGVHYFGEMVDVFHGDADPLEFKLVIREKVTIDHDMQLNFSASEAKNHIHFQTVKLDGAPVYTDKSFFDGNENMTLLEKGNIDDMYYHNRVFCTDYGVVDDVLGNIGVRIQFSDHFSNYFYNHEGDADFFVNDVSDRYIFYSYRSFLKDYEVYTASYEVRGSTGDVTITNDPTEFVVFEDPLIVPTDKDGEHYAAYSMVLYNSQEPEVTDMEIVRFIPVGEGETWKFYLSAATDNNQMGNIPIIIPKMDRFYVDEEDWSYYQYVLSGNQLVKTGNEILLSNAFIEAFFEVEPSDEPNEWGEYYHNLGRFWPTHPAFTYSAEKKTDRFGNNCPTVITRPLQSASTWVWYDDEGNEISQTFRDMYFRFDYIGRYGEWVKDYIDNAKVNIKLNGEDFYSGQGEFRMMLDELLNGTVDATITNDLVEVDELVGSNRVHLHYNASAEDENPPTMTMLHFMDVNGNVTDRFAAADEGVVEFSAGDFNVVLTSSMFYEFNRYAPEMVEVSYSPYGEDTWNELSVEEIPENYWPLMGWFYRGSLEGVTGQAYEGWFDLKIKLTDAAGNWQEQVISPAFRIDNLAYSNVATVGSDNAREVARYNLAGQRVDGDAKGVVIVKMSDGTARKILVP